VNSMLFLFLLPGNRITQIPYYLIKNSYKLKPVSVCVLSLKTVYNNNNNNSKKRLVCYCYLSLKGMKNGY